ncbi:RrF2 family transcriptional regulator [Rhodovulum sp. YNF3179]|uniref:RrF2 family transcriptional regulator n=1 Tax=Rhodovulum sp. YNF3179 TaxID=3425127 RepID=UPI003D34EE2D
MRLTTRTNLAMRTLMFCAVNDARTVRKSDVAEHCNASENHLAQVVNLLGQRGFIRTVRGRNGGIRLNRPAADISVGAVIRAFEADVPFAECFAGAQNTCPITPFCRLKQSLAGAVAAFYSYLDDVTLSDLVAGNAGLEGLLGMPSDAATA